MRQAPRHRLRASARKSEGPALGTQGRRGQGAEPGIGDGAQGPGELWEEARVRRALGRGSWEQRAARRRSAA